MRFIINYIRNMIAIIAGCEPERPLLFSYYVTHRCNLNCRYCSDGSGEKFSNDKVEELKTDDAKNLISIMSHSVDTLDITGGEPLLRSDLAELLAHAKKSGMRTVLNTKGIGLEKRPDVIKNSDLIVISIDSLDAGRLTELTGGAHSHLNTLEYLVNNRNKIKSSIIISSVATPSNLSDISEILDYVEQHDLSFHISPEIVGTKANPELMNNPEYEKLIDEILRRKRRGEGILGVRKYLHAIRDFSDGPCDPLLMPVIRPDGALYYPCLERKRADVNLLESGDYFKAMEKARSLGGPLPDCKGECHIFCHMGLSLFQRHPLDAIRESKYWRI